MGNKERQIIQGENDDFLECNSLPLKWSRSKDYLKPTHKGFYSPCYFQCNFLAKPNRLHLLEKDWGGKNPNDWRLILQTIKLFRFQKVWKWIENILDAESWFCWLERHQKRLADPRWMLTAIRTQHEMEVTEIPLSPSESRVQPTKYVGMGETKTQLGILVCEVLQFSLTDLL